MTTVIEIAAIRPPKEGKKVATVVDANGKPYEIWPEKLASLREGAKYEVEIKEREWNSRTIRQIANAREVVQTDIRQPPDTRPQSSAAAGADQEVAFVSSALNAFIAAGKVNLDARELIQATTTLRMLWSAAFGPGLNTFRAGDARQVRN